MSARDETDWMKVWGMGVGARAEDMRAERRLEVCRDSLPPLRMAAFPGVSAGPLLYDSGIGLTALDSQRGDIDHHLRPRLEYNQQHPDRARHPMQLQSRSQLLRKCHLTRRER